MTYELHMNGVITGSLNSFCLACGIFLKSQHSATEHIGTPEHKNKLGAVQYSEKFQGEHIKKFKAGYYCEFCNVLMPIAFKVISHINEDGHKHNKGILLLKPLDGDVIESTNITIFIDEKAWHGLIDGVCSLCNEEFDDETEHKTDASHSLNLVLKPIQFGADNAIFRHLDDTAVQCLTCNKLLAPGRMTKHFDDSEHQKLCNKRCIKPNRRQNFDTKENCDKNATNITLVIENDAKENSSKKDKSKIIEPIARYSKGFNIDLETETFDYMETEHHNENHTTIKDIDSNLLYLSNLDQNVNRVDINDRTSESSDDKPNIEIVHGIIKAVEDNDLGNTSSEAASHEPDTDTDSSASGNDSPNTPPIENIGICSQEDARDFAKANKISYGHNDQSFCRICKVNVPASLRPLREHVEGANHKRLAMASQNAGSTFSTTRPKAPRKQMKQSTKKFVYSSYDKREFCFTATIINEEFCILLNSFYLIIENTSSKRCIICEVNLPPHSDIEAHVTTRQHSIKWLAVPVIISEKKEFIREVHPGLYHCGYCNLVVPGWGEMKLHLDCFEHQENRTLGEHQLKLYFPTLHQFKMQSNYEAVNARTF